MASAKVFPVAAEQPLGRTSPLARRLAQGVRSVARLLDAALVGRAEAPPFLLMSEDPARLTGSRNLQIEPAAIGVPASACIDPIGDGRRFELVNCH